MARARSAAPKRHSLAATPAALQLRSWGGAIKRTVSEFREDNLMDWAAALTYYSVLSLFPALIALVAIVGLAGQSPDTTNAILRIVTDLGPQSAGETFKGPVESLINNKSAAGTALIVSLVVALWTGSGYIGAFMRASNVIYDVEEGRPFWKRRPFQMAVTLVMVLVLALVGVAIVLTGPVADAVAKPIGLGDAAVTAWNFAKWPFLVAMIAIVISLLYYWAPSERPPGFRWLTPGSVLAIALWLISTGAFALYVATFGSYNKTYGSLGGVVVFLVWLWMTNLAVLLGAEFNAELERSRKLEVAHNGAETRTKRP
jgi:membrane protein